ncbi:hypothetical protein MJO29_000419 [Puccinia striiformis f. sp. tritici]|nr:hypothetical protein MJO29_000419 [Puccinia striiformis f. sp. tritici]
MACKPAHQKTQLAIKPRTAVTTSQPVQQTATISSQPVQQPATKPVPSAAAATKTTSHKPSLPPPQSKRRASRRLMETWCIVKGIDQLHWFNPKKHQLWRLTRAARMTNQRVEQNALSMEYRKVKEVLSLPAMSRITSQVRKLRVLTGDEPIEISSNSGRSDVRVPQAEISENIICASKTLPQHSHYPQNNIRNHSIPEKFKSAYHNTVHGRSVMDEECLQHYMPRYAQSLNLFSFPAPKSWSPSTSRSKPGLSQSSLRLDSPSLCLPQPSSRFPQPLLSLPQSSSSLPQSSLSLPKSSLPATSLLFRVPTPANSLYAVQSATNHDVPSGNRIRPNTVITAKPAIGIPQLSLFSTKSSNIPLAHSAQPPPQSVPLTFTIPGNGTFTLVQENTQPPTNTKVPQVSAEPAKPPLGAKATPPNLEDKHPWAVDQKLSSQSFLTLTNTPVPEPVQVVPPPRKPKAKWTPLPLTDRSVPTSVKSSEPTGLTADQASISHDTLNVSNQLDTRLGNLKAVLSDLVQSRKEDVSYRLPQP